MRKKLSPIVVATCSLLVFGTNDTLACGQGSSSSAITSLPTLGGSGLQVNALNSAGQVTGFSYTAGDRAAHGFLYLAGSLTDLGTFGGAMSESFGLNEAGQIVGDADLSGNGKTHAFLYSGGVLKDLGTLGGSFSSARAINDAGQVVGTSLVAGDAAQRAFLYTAGSMISLGHLGGGSSDAIAINQRGSIAGDSYTADFENHAYLYTNGIMRDLGTLGGDYSSAYALNNADMVAGEASTADYDTHGFIYSGGVMTDVGTLGGTYSSVEALNDAGQGIGMATTLNDEETHGFIFSGGTMTDLGGLGGTYTTPLAINNAGRVVGYSGTANGSSHAFLWQNGTMVDLNTLLPPNSGWDLISAQLINDPGQIAGFGFLNGVFRWFLMTPASANLAPVAVAGPDQTVDCSAQVTLDGTQSSDPDHDTLTFEWSIGGTVLGTSVTLTASLPLGTNVVTLKVTDPCGASAQTDVIVRVLDTTPPTLSCTAPSTASSGPNCQAPIPNLLAQVVASDDCTPRELLTLSQNPSAGTLVGLGEHSIAVTATDSAGNTATCTKLFKVVDTTLPVIVSGPVLAIVSADANCQAPVPDVASQIVAADNCTSANLLVMNQSPAAGTPLGLGQHTIRVTVTDASGNSASTEISFTVADTTAPAILGTPGATAVSVGANCQAAVPNVLPAVTAADNCTPANSLVMNQSPAAGTFLGLGQHTIRVTVTDASGNSSATEISLTVADTAAPTILSTPGATAVSVGANCQAAVPNVLPAVTAADNCTPANLLAMSQSPAAGTLLPAGVYVLTVTATNASGNHSSTDIPLTVADTTAPVISSLTASPSVLSSPNHQMVAVTISISASDNCDPAPVSRIASITCNEQPSPGDIQITGNLTANLAASRDPAGNGRVYTITVATTDASGNRSDRTVTVTVPKSNGNGNGRTGHP